LLKIDGHDNAIIGPAFPLGKEPILVYDGEQIKENLVKAGMSEDEAMDFIEFNIEGAYMGPMTPVIAWKYTEFDDFLEE
jgi:hypothetical protein